jgi:putative hydrolase of the HAD superfamily
MKHINHIFFDLDHTLWDFEANSDIAFKTIFKKYDVGIDIKKFLSHYRAINQNYWKLYRNEKITKAELRVGRLRDTFAKIKQPFDNQLIDNLAYEYIEVLPNNNQLFEGTHEILKHLFPKYKLHIITNGFNEVQYKKLQNSGLSKYFDKIITSEDAGVKKPNPIIFNFALDLAQATSKESLMIGDNWEADVMGAIDNGIDAIYFNYEKQPVSENIKSVHQLLEIKKYL